MQNLPSYLPIINTILIVFGGGFLTYITAYKKNRADANKANVDALSGIIRNITDENKRMADENSHLRQINEDKDAQLSSLKEEISELREEIKKLNQKITLLGVNKN